MCVQFYVLMLFRYAIFIQLYSSTKNLLKFFTAEYLSNQPYIGQSQDIGI